MTNASQICLLILQTRRTAVQPPFGSLPPTPANDDGVSDVPPVHTANMTDGPPTFGPVGTVHSTQDPSTIIPPSTDDSVTTFPAEAPVLPNSNPPLCSRVINVTWLSLPPFIFQSNDNTDVLKNQEIRWQTHGCILRHYWSRCSILLQVSGQ